jgi:hypothetical protein
MDHRFLKIAKFGPPIFITNITGDLSLIGRQISAQPEHPAPV